MHQLIRKPPRRPNYDRKLARPITLDDGRRLITLKDAADLLAGRFSTVRAWAALDCVELLMVAATTGTRADIKAATDQIEVVLRARQLL